VTTTQRAHLITGGFPPGSAAGHDMDYARLQLLQKLHAKDHLAVTVANDFQDLERWLPGTDFLVTYVAGPYPAGVSNEALSNWLQNGGRWFALHGTSGGKAVKTEHQGRPVKKMLKAEHHQTLGCFFLNHPPLREFQVSVTGEHPVTQDLPQQFTVRDELYLIELQDPDASHILLTTELAADPSPPGFGFFYDEDTSILADGITRALGYARGIGRGEVVYIGLGHCHTGRTNSQSTVDASIHSEGSVPIEFRGVWETEAFTRLLQNAVSWGIAER
jgi:type 1 glutamine amidotransferase